MSPQCEGHQSVRREQTPGIPSSGTRMHGRSFRHTLPVRKMTRGGGVVIAVIAVAGGSVSGRSRAVLLLLPPLLLLLVLVLVLVLLAAAVCLPRRPRRGW